VQHTFVDFHVDVAACNTNASDVCEIKFTYLLTYLLNPNPNPKPNRKSKPNTSQCDEFIA